MHLLIPPSYVPQLKAYHDDKKQYEKDLAKWKSEQPTDAEGNLLPEPKPPVQKEFKEPVEPGEEYIRPRMVKDTATTKGGWARGDKDAAQDLKDREELADIRWDVLLWLKGVFVLKFILFLMMLFVVTIIFMLLFKVRPYLRALLAPSSTTNSVFPIIFDARAGG